MGTAMKDSRKEERFSVAHSVNLGNAGGITRDFSTSGMYIETAVPDMPYVPGDKIGPTIKLDCPWGELMLKCNGEIVRVENRQGGIGLAMKINELAMATDS
ncbi:MAG: PilZ domain-containing protein [Nitrosospira sp.]|nr:PilZ domain-containing protein [Nitrosospira sp.]